MSSFHHGAKKAFGVLLATVAVFSVFLQPLKGPAGADRPGIVLYGDEEDEDIVMLPLNPSYPSTY